MIDKYPEWLENVKRQSPKANEKVLRFIYDFRIISGNPRQFNYRDVSVWFFKSIKILPATF